MFFCLTSHAFVSKLAKMAAAVIAQATWAINASSVWSTSLCESSEGNFYYFLDNIVLLMMYADSVHSHSQFSDLTVWSHVPE